MVGQHERTVHSPDSVWLEHNIIHEHFSKVMCTLKMLSVLPKYHEALQQHPASQVGVPLRACLKMCVQRGTVILPQGTQNHNIFHCQQKRALLSDTAMLSRPEMCLSRNDSVGYWECF